VVDIEDINADATDRSAAYEIGTFPVKMSVPFVTARIEKGSELAGQRISTADVRAFEGIAVETAERQIAGHCRAVVLL
jgi:hypothetical protein